MKAVGRSSAAKEDGRLRSDSATHRQPTGDCEKEATVTKGSKLLLPFSNHMVFVITANAKKVLS